MIRQLDRSVARTATRGHRSSCANGIVLAGQGHAVLTVTTTEGDYILDNRRDDIRFVLEVVSEADPWFEQGASANLFAGRFRNFVVARCRSQGLNLSSDELDLIDAWFMSGSGAPKAQAQAAPSYAPRPDASPRPPVPHEPASYSFRQAATYTEPAQQPQALQSAALAAPSQSDRWWGGDEQQDRGSPSQRSQDFDDHDPKDLPRIALPDPQSMSATIFFGLPVHDPRTLRAIMRASIRGMLTNTKSRVIRSGAMKKIA